MDASRTIRVGQYSPDIPAGSAFHLARHEAAFGETVPANLRGSSGAAGDFAGKGTVCHVCSGAQLVSAICLAYGTMWPRRITAHRSNASSRVAADTGLRRRRFLLGRQISGSFASAIATIARATHAPWKKNAHCVGSPMIIISGRSYAGCHGQCLPAGNLGGNQRCSFSSFKSSDPLKADWQRHVLASSGYLELGMFDDAAHRLWKRSSLKKRLATKS